MDERKGAVIVVTQDINDGNALLDEFVGAGAGGLVIDAGNDSINVPSRGKWFDPGRPRNASMESPISGVVVNIPFMDFADKLGNAPQHIPSGSDGGLDFE